MSKIAFLTGAFKNAGDFLIVERSEALLRHCIPDCELVPFERNVSLEGSKNLINECDFIVFAGGPGFNPHMYPKLFPLVPDLSQLTPPMVSVGMGARVMAPPYNNIKFDSSSKELLDRFSASEVGIGCRDIITKNALNGMGYADAIMTGCPAWYDLDRINRLQEMPLPHSRADVKRIAISDPILIPNFALVPKIVELLQREFPAADIVLAMHRGWHADEFTNSHLAEEQVKLRDQMRRGSIDVVDLAYSSRGFSVYDESDLHVGFRVHAHIYNLSHGHATFLLEEDCRGFGLNETLGLEHVSISSTSYAEKVVRLLSRSKLPFQSKSRILASLSHAIEASFEDGFSSQLGAYEMMQASFLVMEDQLKRLDA